MLTLEQITEKIKHKNIYSGILCNNPQPIFGQAEPKVIFYKEYHKKDIEYSVVIPVFNQEEIIEKNALSIINHMDGDFEIIFILDNCVDNTESILLNLFKNINISNLIRAIIIKQETPIFETSCDNIGFIVSSGKYILEIQADMEMTQQGFNSNLARGLNKYQDIIGVSGRCTHIFGAPIGVGKLGELIEKSLNSSLDKNSIYMYGTCNRGPLLLDKNKLHQMNFLDEENYFLDDSDHDLFARSFYLKGWRCGYIPIEFNSPLKNGSTRKPAINESVKLLNQEVFNIKYNRPKNGFLNKLHTLNPPPIEIRPL